VVGTVQTVDRGQGAFVTHQGEAAAYVSREALVVVMVVVVMMEFVRDGRNGR